MCDTAGSVADGNGHLRYGVLELLPELLCSGNNPTCRCTNQFLFPGQPAHARLSRLARTLAIATVRKDAAGEFDLQLLREQADALVALAGKVSEITTKARTVRSSGEQIEKLADELKQGFDSRLGAISAMLRSGGQAE